MAKGKFRLTRILLPVRLGSCLAEVLMSPLLEQVVGRWGNVQGSSLCCRETGRWGQMDRVTCTDDSRCSRAAGSVGASRQRPQGREVRRGAVLGVDETSTEKVVWKTQEAQRPVPKGWRDWQVFAAGEEGPIPCLSTG